MRHQIIMLHLQGYSHVQIYGTLGGRVSLDAITDLCLNYDNDNKEES